jgi:thiamine biosynthesis lipoprotein
MALLRDAKPLMGTVFSIAVPDSVEPKIFEAAWSEACELLRRIEEIYSPFIPDSPVSRIRDGRLGPADLSWQPDLSAEEAEDFREILGLCAQLRHESDGAFDAWFVGDPPNFDPCGAVKGWAAERASALLVERGVVAHLLNAGGDVRVRAVGRATWNVGVEDPHRPDRMLLSLPVREGAVATSGTRQRGSHVWDPLRRRPAEGLAQVTIVGPDLALADGYATAAMAMGERARGFLTELGARGPYQGFTVDEAQGVWWTEGFEEHAPTLRGLLRPSTGPGPDMRP